TGTVLAVTSSQQNLYGTGGRGFLVTNSDVDFWNFDLQAGDKVLVQGNNPGNPGNSGLNYELYNPAGSMIGGTLTADNNGSFAFHLFTAATTGTHSLRVSVYHGYNSEYRFRVYIIRGDLQLESESNDLIANADPLSLTLSGTTARASVAGVSRFSGDLDYYN